MTKNKAIFGKGISKRCHSLPDLKVMCKPGSCKCRRKTKVSYEGCVCAKALLNKDILSPRDIFDELGNYNYCSGVLAKIIGSRKLSSMRNCMNDKMSTIMPDHRYATAHTILRHNLENFVYGVLPGESKSKCVRVVLEEMADEDDNIIKLSLVERRHRSHENEKCSIFPYVACMTPYELLSPIDISDRHYRLHELLEADEETEDDSSETFESEVQSSDSDSDNDSDNDDSEVSSECTESFNATVNLKFWDEDVPFEMTIQNVSLDLDKCECVINFSREDYEHFTAKRQRRH